MWSFFLQGAVAGYGIAIPVGAVAILIVNTSLQCGFRIGFLAGAGAATADFIYALLAVIAGAAIVVFLQPVTEPLRIVSGIVLVGLAIFGLWKGLKDSRNQSGAIGGCHPLPTYTRFTAITLVNPLTVVYFTALILGRNPGENTVFSSQLAFVLGAALASLSWQTLLAALGGFAHGRLPARFQKGAVILGNLIILGFGLIILLNLRS